VKAVRITKSMAGLATLLLGLVYCVVLFTYGVTQEVPIGQLEGNVILAENGKPLAGAEVTLSVPYDDSASPDNSR